MTQTDLIFDIDAFVQSKENQGFYIEEILDAMNEFIEIQTDLCTDGVDEDNPYF